MRFQTGVGITGPTSRVYPFEITRGATAADIPSSGARLAAERFRRDRADRRRAGFPAMAASFVERGRVLVVSSRLFADVSAIYPDNRVIASQALDLARRRGVALGLPFVLDDPARSRGS